MHCCGRQLWFYWVHAKWVKLRWLSMLCNPMARTLIWTRKLAPWHSNQGKRLVKSHKVYIRDSGLLHSLLGITDIDALLSHPIVGASWKGHVIESLLAVAPAGTQPSRRWLIYPGSECYPLGDGIEVMSLNSAMQALV